MFVCLEFNQSINHFLVGKPINVERTPHPTDVQIDELHEKYIQQVINLYEEHKNKYGYGDITIKIK